LYLSSKTYRQTQGWGDIYKYKIHIYTTIIVQPVYLFDRLLGVSASVDGSGSPRQLLQVHIHGVPEEYVQRERERERERKKEREMMCTCYTI